MAKCSIVAAVNITLSTARAARAENVEIFLTDIHGNRKYGNLLGVTHAHGVQANPYYSLRGHTSFRFSDLVHTKLDRVIATVIREPESRSCLNYASCAKRPIPPPG